MEFQVTCCWNVASLSAGSESEAHREMTDVPTYGEQSTPVISGDTILHHYNLSFTPVQVIIMY
ncbi:hypothetical protein E2C01_037554 [Portunus trituberculatus]|uniref:Uncharacterized protein n=1 Tax=Portunus trituberculatus TaxID=210409 RepID=A0A5B7FF91_PORTR|nr:hypothetical protein [Portunus trituberculatus]